MRNTRPAASARAAITIMLAAAAACASDPSPRLGREVVIAGTDASNPTTAVDPASGTYYVAWVGQSDGQSNVYVARSQDGQTFSSPVRANDIPGDAAPHEQAPAQVAVGPDGHVYVLWQNNTHAEGRRFPYSDLRFARSIDRGLTFEPAITVNDDAGGSPSSHTFHDLEVAPDGTVVVSWIDSRVRAAAERAASPSPSAEATPAASHTGHGMGGMHDANLPGPEIRIARSTDGGRTFNSSVIVASSACPCCRTSLAAATGRVLYLAWRDVGEGDIRDIVVARSDDGGATFSEPVFVHEDGWRIEGCPHAGPALAVDAGGRLHAAWYTGAEGRTGIHHAVSEDGGRTFGAPHAVMTSEWVPISQVRLASLGDQVWIAWDDRRPESPVIGIGAAALDGAPMDATTGGQGTSPALAGSGDRFAIAWFDEGSIRFRGGVQR